MSRYASLWNKRDACEKAILRALADLIVPYVEGGPCDGWLIINGRWICVEFKSEKGRLTPKQKEFTDTCQRNGWPYMILRSAAEAVESVQSWRQRA